MTAASEPINSAQMKIFSRILLPALLVQLMVPAFTSKAATDTDWERSVVSVEVTRKTYDYIQPWVRDTSTTVKAGTYLGDNLFLTTANNLNDVALIRLQKNGRGRWHHGELKWIDYHANLALVSAKAEDFLEGLKATPIVGEFDEKAKLHSVNWRSGRTEKREATFDNWTVETGQISYIATLYLQVNSDASSLVEASPMFSEKGLVGLGVTKSGETATLIPGFFLKRSIEAWKKGNYPGLGFFDFTWTPARNPSILDFLKLEGESRGVLVIKVPKIPGVESPIKVRDLILEVDGKAIDNEGDYVDPKFGQISLENLSTYGKWAGDIVKIKLLRKGKVMMVDYKIPNARFDFDLVPDEIHDQEPEYLLVAGLVFQPLTETFLSRWGSSWERRAPFRLVHYNGNDPTEERPGLIVLSVVLPHPINLTYEGYRYQVVDKVNGKSIASLKDLKTALENPQEGFHVVEFMKGSSQRRLVLNAAETKEATQQVMETYAIAWDHVLND